MGRFRKNDRYDRFGKYQFEEDGLIGENKSTNHVGLSFYPCPFSTQGVKEFGAELDFHFSIYGNPDLLYHIKFMLSDIYTEVPDGTDYITLNGTVLYVPDALVDHTYNDKEYYLQTSYKGVWGYECTFPNCPHKLITGRNYFYV
jgi:hypothetical protein